MPRKRKEEMTIEPGKGLNLDPELIKRLVPGTLERATIATGRAQEGNLRARTGW
ncbi:putative transposase [Burkholderia pseudomallei K42]|nr:putative transposase [Burkholderia pseudomallei K42]